MKHILTIFSFFFICILIKSQTVGVNSTGAFPATSAMLDVSSTDKGILIPRVNIIDLNTAAPVAAPVTSLLVYNTNVASGVGYYFWDGSKWVQLSDANSNSDEDWYEVGTSVAPNSINDNIFTQGNVGIDIISPQHKLVVSESNSTNSSLTFDGFTASSATDLAAILPGSDFGGLIQGGTNGNLVIGIRGNDGNDGFLIASGSGNYITDNTYDNAILFARNDGNVGIGTVSPSQKLDVTGGAILRAVNASYFWTERVDSDFDMIQGAASTKRTLSIHPSTTGSDVLAVYANNGSFFSALHVKNTTGNVGLGTQTPAYQLQLSANSAAKPTTSTWTVASDRRLKENIKPYKGGLSDVLEIAPVWFTYNGKAGMPKDTGVGIIAQDLQRIAPYMVSEWTYEDSKVGNKENYLGVDNGAMTYMLINAVKELKAENDLLKKRLDKLENN